MTTALTTLAIFWVAGLTGFFIGLLSAGLCKAAARKPPEA